MRQLTETDFIEAAKKIGCDVAAIKAVDRVESFGSGFLKDGRMKILFEGHIFWRMLERKGIDINKHLEGNDDILYRKWTKEHYIGGYGEHVRLARAAEIDQEAALMSASWGRYQIMGMNYRLCGFSDVFEMYYVLGMGEKQHLDAFVNFVKKTRLDDELRDHRWEDFARGYNGPMYFKNNYHIRIKEAYDRFKK